MASSSRKGSFAAPSIRSEDNNSIQVHREVTVVSSQEILPIRKAPPVASDIRRPSTGKSVKEAEPAEPRTSMQSSDRGRRGLSWNPMQPHFSSQTSEDIAVLDTNREGMRALSEFLTKIPPPPSNLMAKDRDGDEKSIKSVKKSAFKIFSKLRGKKENLEPRLLQLPESAVSSTTGSGSRYIAITVPLGHPAHSSFNPEISPNTSRRESFTVLKPVAEVRESNSFNMLNDARGRSEYAHGRESQNVTPAIDIVGSEAAKTLENFYRQQRRRSQPDRVNSTKSSSSRLVRNYVAFPPPVPSPQDSQRTPRNSTSATTNNTNNHSRAVSSVSTAPSIRRLDPPPRHSSLSRIPHDSQRELANIQTPVEEKNMEESEKLPSMLSTNTMRSTSSISPPTVTGTAETARRYSAGVVELENLRPTPRPSPAPPSKTLIDISGSQVLVIQRPSTAPPSQSRPIKTEILKRHSTAGANGLLTISSLDPIDAPAPPPSRQERVDPFDPLSSPKQSRQERVKVRKSRDMAVHYIQSLGQRRMSAPVIYDVRNSDPEFPQDLSSPNSFFTPPQSTFQSNTNDSKSYAPPTNLAEENENAGLRDRGLYNQGRDSIDVASQTESRGIIDASGIQTLDADAEAQSFRRSTSTRSRRSRRKNMSPFGETGADEFVVDRIVSDFSILTPRSSYQDITPSRPSGIHLRNSSHEVLAKKRSYNSLSPVMTVATFPEFTGFVDDTDLPYIPPVSNSSIRRAHTSTAPHTGQKRDIDNIVQVAPRSIFSSQPAYTYKTESSDTNSQFAMARPRSVPPPRSVDSLAPLPPRALEDRRQERRQKRNAGVKEKMSRNLEMERRLSRIERDHQIVLRALTGIAENFQELKQYYPQGDVETIKE